MLISNLGSFKDSLQEASYFETGLQLWATIQILILT